MRLSLPRLPRTTSYDLTLVAVVLALLAIGLAMVYSASGIPARDQRDDPSFYLFQQSLWAALGLVAMAAAARIDYHRLRPFAVPLLVVVLVLLALVLLPGLGTRVGGAARWLRVGGFGLQPSEVAKLALVVYLAFWLDARKDLAKSGAALPFAGLVGTTCALVVAEPDLGTAIVIGMLALAMYFVAGARLSIFGLIGLAALGGAVVAALAQPYRVQRVLTFLDPWSDPRGAGFQTIQALYALALGGPFGEGLGASREKAGFLPAPYTDSIFAVLGEELGLAGSLTVILLFLLLAFRGTRIALRAPDREGTLLATGVTMWLAAQAWINIAVVASLVPMTGITLPFISYGGSSLLVGLAAVGILLNVGHQGTAEPAHQPRGARGARGWGNGRSREPAPRDRRSPRRLAPVTRAVRRWPPRARG